MIGREGMADRGEFDVLLRGVLAERSGAGAQPEGLEQRLLARLLQAAESFEQERVRRAPGFGVAAAVQAGRGGVSLWAALGAHAFLAVLLLLVLGRTAVSDLVKTPGMSVSTLSLPPQPPVLPRADRMGGGGGHPDAAPAAQGRLPKFAERQIEAPKAPPLDTAKITVEPTVVMQKDLKMAENALPNLGVPNSPLAGSSLGNGRGTGIGAGDGSGVGPGSDGNAGGSVRHAGGAVSQPEVLYSVDPEFSEEARKAKFSGNVEVYLVVDEHGRPTHVRVARGVGMGLDEKAIEAVKQYRFKPAMLHGEAVKVDLYVDVSFNIY